MQPATLMEAGCPHPALRTLLPSSAAEGTASPPPPPPPPSQPVSLPCGDPWGGFLKKKWPRTGRPYPSSVIPGAAAETQHFQLLPAMIVLNPMVMSIEWSCRTT